MKVSKDEKSRTRRKIIEAAVGVISKKGIKDSTMREIAESAGVGDATIYKYFPTKENILFGYFDVHLDDLIERLRDVKDFNKFSFQEQLHTLLETNLELMKEDRAFVQIAYEGVFLTNWIAAAMGSKETKERFLEIIDDLVESAVEVGEFEEPPFKKFLYELFWDYSIGVTYYWLKDESVNTTSTTQMIDKTLGVLVAMLKSNLLNKGVDLVQFMVREHILSKIRPASERNFDLTKLKRQFMEKKPEPAQKKKGARKL